jgi:CelD/BcsL family acetyltransferase involved in cellulose biosynthesis
MTTTESRTVRRGDSGGAEAWQAQTVRDDAALTSLATEWDDLYDRCSTATAFQSFAWLESWWRSYGRPGQLVLVLVRKAGRLVAAAPMMRRRRIGVPVLAPLGAAISDFTDVLIDDSCAPEAARHLARELVNQPQGHVIDLAEVPDLAAVWHLVDAWPLRIWRLPGSICTELSARPMQELIDALPRNDARTRRKKQRKIQAAGIESRVVTGHAGEAIAALLRLHREQWRGRGMNPEHGRARFAAHLSRAVPAMVERGHAHLVEYRLAGDLVAVELLLTSHRLLCGYLYGFRPDLRRRIDVAQLLLGTDLELAQQLDRPTLSLLRGDEPYKRHWRPRQTRNQRVLLSCRGRLPAAQYAAAVRDRGRLGQAVKTRLPWLAGAGRRVKACLPFST